jgi:cyclic-di-GMP phosphodiesterase TipF (flagellum assembly factor)
VIEFLTTLACAVLSASFAWSLYRFEGLASSESAVSGALLFLLMLQLRASVVRARERRGFEDDLDTLRAANDVMRTALDETKKTMTEVTTALAKRSDSQEKKLTGELQRIARMIRDFAERAAAKANAAPPAQRALAAEAHPAFSGPAPHELARPSMLELALAGEAHPAFAGPAPHGLAQPSMLELIRRALEENRVDLYLQPVVSLPQRKVRFYEALTRLRSEDGAVIMPAQYIKVAAPAGLMSVVDNLLLFRCVQVVRRLTQKSRNIGVFCNISGQTLSDAQFFPQFLEFMHHHKDLAGQIIFEFPEDAVLAAGPAEEANLRYLRGLGFRLSMDQVSKLDLDFAALKRLGFEFVKVRAGTLIHGMKTTNAQVAAEDLKDLLARNGINLIAERIEDEKAVVQLLDFNVGFGQGYLFGAPRPVKELAEVYDPRAKQLSSGDVGTALTAGLGQRLAG